MTSWILCWLMVPAVVVVLSIGLGLLAQWAARTPMSGPVVVAMGMSALVVLATLLTTLSVTVALSGPLVLALAGAGWVLGWPSMRWHSGRTWPSLAALAAFICYAAPVALSGGVSWAGFIKLDDSATWMALGDRLASAGNTTTDLAHSTYGVLVGLLLNSGYPVGAFADLGMIGRLTGQDIAFVLAPLMATLAAGLAFALYAATQGLVRSVVWRAVIAFIASTSALLVGYVLWGGIKEVTLALLLTTACLMLTRGKADTRPLLGQAALLAVPLAGVLVVFGIAGAVYLAPLALVETVLIWRSYGFKSLLRAAAVFVGVIAVLGFPTWRVVSLQLSTAGASELRGSQDIGNLFGPLSFWQVFGVWPTGDFRVAPESRAVTALLIAVVVGGVIGGVLVGIRRRLPAVPVFVGMSLLLSVGSVFGNAWLVGKVLAVAAPAMLLAAGVAFAHVAESGRRFEGMALIGLVGVGVLVSNTMAYREVWIAPADRMQELATIGAIDAPKPALILEYNPAAARYLLRYLDTEGAGELRYNEIPMYGGKGLGKGDFGDIDDFPVTTLAAYPTLVLRTELTASRPPSVYVVSRPGTYYDVWTADRSVPAILSHWPLGDHSDPAAPAPCDIVKQAIAVAGQTGRVAAAVRPPQVVVSLSDSVLPPGWTVGAAPGSVSVSSPGTVTSSFDVPADGTYLATIGGSIFGGVTVSVDGQEWYSDQGRLNWTPYSNPMPARSLTKGAHTLTVTYSVGWLPGQGYTPSSIGPVVLSTSGANVPVTYVSTADALTLCGKRLDWVEAVAS